VRGHLHDRGLSVRSRACVYLTFAAGDVHVTASGSIVGARILRGGAVLWHAAETRATGEKASETDGTVCVDEGGGQMLLAWVDIQWRVKQGEEAWAGRDGGVIGGGVWEEASEGGEGKFWETSPKGKVLVSKRREASGVCI